MKKVLLTVVSNLPTIRQTPGRSGCWGDYCFTQDPQDGPFDYWVVFDSVGLKTLSTHVESGHALLIPQEPPAYRDYQPKFLSQFSAILSFRDDFQHPLIHKGAPMIPWWIGLQGEMDQRTVNLDYDQLAQANPKKDRCISIIRSGKDLTPEHRKRLRCVEALVHHFGDRIDAFGFDSKPIDDKWEAIAPYRYHIAMENSSHADYWTEKIADAYLGGAMPLYWGCPNLGEYFPDGSYRRIDRDDPQAAIDQIERVLAEDPYETSRDSLVEAKNRVMQKHNLFAKLCETFPTLPRRTGRKIKLKPEEAFYMSWRKRLERRFRAIRKG